MTVFHLLRHGVTSHTGHRLTGWMPDVALTDEGRAQAEAAGSILASVPLKAIYSSPITRTLQTAEIVAAPHRLPVRTRPALGEVQYGKWTNRTFKSLRRVKLWGTLHHWPSGVRFPGGETLLEVQARAMTELEVLRGRHPKDHILCVSHADVLKLVVAHSLGVPLDLFGRIEISPASITVIHMGDSGPHVLTVNSVPPKIASKS